MAIAGSAPEAWASTGASAALMRRRPQALTGSWCGSSCAW
jgi:hypothetical protein